MRRLFIIRKDLHLSAGKLSAMVGHCSEAYWTTIIRNSNMEKEDGKYKIEITLDACILDDYVNGIFTKTICQARNKNQLLRGKEIAKECGLIEGIDFGEINDKCLTELAPENEDGTTTVGLWFKPLEDEVAHKISKKYQLYKD